MKINNKLLSIPPYLSTSWGNVSAVYMQDTRLVVSLLDGDAIEIPNLSGSTIETIFSSHAAFLEEENSSTQSSFPGKLASHPFTQALMQAGLENTSDNPFRLSFTSIDELGSVLQHNPLQAGAPDIPREILQKIAAITKIISAEDSQLMPKAEAHCNCVHCQISRALSDDHDSNLIEVKAASSEEVKDEELEFQQWDITPNGANLFQVINRLDDKEKYCVHLGTPVGCTCGKEGCEHIIAVLKS